jgi:SPP1 family predicted phage head-tail adaptor
MRGGDLRHKIYFQDKSASSDGMGGSTWTWSDSFAAWAGIWPVSANEVIKNEALEHQITHRIRVRYESRIEPKLRIRFGSRYFEIVSIINPNERGIVLDIMATEKKDT